jgi:hypothetical protein
VFVIGDEILKALEHVWNRLQSLNLPMALMGGIALSAWKHPRATQDLDLLIAIDETEWDAVLSHLANAGIRPKRIPPVLTVGQQRIVQLLYRPPGTYLDLQIDLLLAESEYQKMALGRRIVIQVPGLELAIAVLSCEDLVLLKLMAGRILDRADVAALLRANKASIDIPLVMHWSEKLGIRQDLDEIWSEAFPGESLPAARG